MSYRPSFWLNQKLRNWSLKKCKNIQISSFAYLWILISLSKFSLFSNFFSSFLLWSRFLMTNWDVLSCLYVLWKPNQQLSTLKKNWHFFSLCHETVSMVMVKINKRLSEISKRYKFWSSTDNWARSNAMASYSNYPSIYTTPRAVIYVFGFRDPKNLTFWVPFWKFTTWVM